MGWGTVLAVRPACDHCGNEVQYIDIDRPGYSGYTHNCNPMMRRALEAVGNLEALGEEHLYALSGMSCTVVAELLQPAIDWWRDHREEMAELNPANGWGSEPSAFEFWSNVAERCSEFPGCKLYMNG